jgi:hypothetical protein
MVPGLCRVVEDCRRLRVLGRAGDDLRERSAIERRAHDEVVQFVNVSGMVLSVVDGDRASRNDRLERILRVRQLRKRDADFCLHLQHGMSSRFQ